MLTLSEDRLIELPADLCRRLGWEPGQALEAVDAGSGVVLRPVPAEPVPIDREAVRVAIEKLREGVTYNGPPIPIEKLGIDGPDGLTYEEVYPNGEYPDAE